MAWKPQRSSFDGGAKRTGYGPTLIGLSSNEKARALQKASAERRLEQHIQRVMNALDGGTASTGRRKPPKA
jgi:hypothetical protein